MRFKLLSVFQKKKKRAKKPRKAKNKDEHTKIKTELNNLRAQFGIVNILLKKHDEQIAENSIILEKHVNQITTLEEMATNQPTSLQINRSKLVNRPTSTTEPICTTQSKEPLQSQKLDISRFSPQEKRILSVFFQHQDMALSYADIAQYLSKSPNTIKNQVRQINMKADLFNFTVDNQSRKRYKFKNGLKIEKYLNVHPPDESPNRLN